MWLVSYSGYLFFQFPSQRSLSQKTKQRNGVPGKLSLENLAIQDDESNEMLLKIALTYLDNRFLASNFYRFHDEENGRIFRDSILTANYKGYVNKYDTKLYVFEDSTFNPLFNDDDLTYESLSNIISIQSKQSRTIP